MISYVVKLTARIYEEYEIEVRELFKIEPIFLHITNDVNEAINYFKGIDSVLKAIVKLETGQTKGGT